MAACALVAASDGRVSLSERSRVDLILESLEGLSLFDPHEGVEAFNRYLQQLEDTLRRLDLPTRRLDHAEVLEREPHVTGRVLGGLLVERDHQVDPRLMVRPTVV